MNRQEDISKTIFQLTRVGGFTLLELMIAITLGLVLVAGVAYTYLGNRAAYRQQDSLAQMQESARYAFELLNFDARMVGFSGCVQNASANLVNNSADGYGNLFSQPLIGYQEGVSTFPSSIAASRVRGDAFTVLRADTSNEYIVQSHNAATGTITLMANHDLQAGQILVITNCQQSSTFQMTGGSANTITHLTGTTNAPGNCTQGFGLVSGVPQCGTPLGAVYTYANGSRVYRLSGASYFIGNNSKGQPSLFRQRFTQASGNATTVLEEMVEGVQDMQVTYGVDTTSTADGVVDTYVSADHVTDAATPGATAAEQWRRVLSVRISLLMRSMEDNVTTDKQAYVFDGAAALTPDDRRLRKVFTTTIALRNRL